MQTTKETGTRRSEIIAAADALFQEAGFAKTSVEGITKRAGTAKGNFYNYFKSKDEVYAAITAEKVEAAVAALTTCLEKPGEPPKRRLESALDTAFALFIDQRQVLSDPAMRVRMLETGCVRLVPALAALLREQDGHNAEDAAFAATAMMGGLCAAYAAYGGMADAAALRRRAGDFVNRFLTAESTGGRAVSHGIARDVLPSRLL